MRGLRSACAAIACCAAAAWADPQSAALGRRLFEGDVPMAASVAGQGLALPTQASRCVNCHLLHAPATATASSGPRSQRFGPVLNAAHLREPMRRRGGPPSRYDADSFCRLLRTGIDPASVIVDRNMPRFEVGAAECAALWAYLIEPR